MSVIQEHIEYPSQYSIVEVSTIDDAEHSNESIKVLFPLLDYSEQITNPSSVMKKRLRDLTGVIDFRPGNEENNKLKCSIDIDNQNLLRINSGDFIINNIYIIFHDENILDTKDYNNYFDTTSSCTEGNYYVAIRYNEEDYNEGAKLGFIKAISWDKTSYNDYCILATININEDLNILSITEYFDLISEPFISRKTIPDYNNNSYRFQINGGVLNENGAWTSKWVTQ
jgi:hypothetical protein